MAGLYHVLEIKCGSQRVFDTFRNIDGVKTWWTVNAELVGTQPDIYFFKFPSGASNKMQVLNTIGGTSVHWKCLAGHDEWVGTEITFEIVEKNIDVCELRFRHFNWEEETPFLGTCNHFWGFYLDRLKIHCES